MGVPITWAAMDRMVTNTYTAAVREASSFERVVPRAGYSMRSEGFSLQGAFVSRFSRSMVITTNRNDRYIQVYE